MTSFLFSTFNAILKNNMASVSGAIVYILIFLSVYTQVFLLVTFFENRKKIVIRRGATKLAKYPAVTIIVPSFNEEKTIYRTIRSLLALNYPKEKIQILLIDDGSTDGTWSVIQKFAKYSNIKIFHKENGGKYTALNLGLMHTKTNFVGCLDADSVADRESLARIMSYFEKDPSVMAVAPSVIVDDSRNMVQSAQKVEYHMGVYMKKMLGLLGAINVTPGPLSIFKKKVFDDLGPYVQAHSTEDMEIAYRMQKHHYKIEHCNDAYVYTNIPPTIKKLFKQRLRWIYGFINNTLDYRGILFRKKYGNFSLFTVPAAILSVISVGYLFSRVTYDFVSFLYNKIIQFQTVGFQVPASLNNFDLFFVNTHSAFFVLVCIYFLVTLSIVLGRKMAEGKWGISFGTLYFFLIFSIVGPLWLVNAIFNTLISRAPSWR